MYVLSTLIVVLCPVILLAVLLNPLWRDDDDVPSPHLPDHHRDSL